MSVILPFFVYIPKLFLKLALHFSRTNPSPPPPPPLAPSAVEGNGLGGGEWEVGYREVEGWRQGWYEFLC